MRCGSYLWNERSVPLLVQLDTLCRSGKIDHISRRLHMCTSQKDDRDDIAGTRARVLDDHGC